LGKLPVHRRLFPKIGIPVHDGLRRGHSQFSALVCKLPSALPAVALI
jgi:hypothetical protein